MKKVVIISLLAQILWGSDDYLPVSKLTDEKKYEYGFLNKENQKEIVKAKNNINDDGYEPIKEIKVDVQEEIKVEKTELPKRVVEEKKLEIKEKDYKKETVNKEFVADNIHMHFLYHYHFYHKIHHIQLRIDFLDFLNELQL